MDYSQVSIPDLKSSLESYKNLISFYLPLGIIGIWRWTTWVFKKGVGRYYIPKTNYFKTTVSIVTPVYNEHPVTFRAALLSWRENNPNEIIAVIDYTDLKAIKVFREFARSFKKAKLRITKTPGKRAALVDGIRVAKGEIIALVDSDTLWDKDVIRNGLSPFADPKVAGVCPRQNVLTPSTLAQRIFDIQLDLRCFDELPFLAAAGDAIACICGRTGFYRKKVVLTLCDDLLNETFFGRKVISGDDKRLTNLVLKAGWKVAYQSNARIYTPGMKDMLSYLKQRLRWTRNSLRSDIKALLQGWPFKHPAFAFFQIDKFIQAFVIILSPIYFLVSLYFGLYLAAGLIVVWWFLSRALKIYPHLKRRPNDILILPFYILYTFISASLKIYAFFTLNTHSWITRWDKSRLPQFRFLQQLPAYALTCMVIFVMTSLVFGFKNSCCLNSSGSTLAYSKNKSDKFTSRPSVLGTSTSSGHLGNSIEIYEVKSGETLSTIAEKFNVALADLYTANAQFFPNWNTLDSGIRLSIPSPNFSFSLSEDYNFIQKTPPTLQVSFDEKKQTINVAGRGNILTLSVLKAHLGDEYIEEVEPKVWLLKKNLYLGTGTRLIVDKGEVSWLKLLSTDNDFVWIKAHNANVVINGVKITSWDQNLKDVDLNYKNGRSFIVARASSQMDVYDSEVSYLGYHAPPERLAPTYGISWRASVADGEKYLLTGEVKNSKFHHNYFGAYTFGATGMVWKNNDFYSNIQYGFDPHDDSNYFLVEGNRAYNNGNHGIIFSKRCINNTIKNNLSYNNKLHGIMLDKKSNNNIVESNTVYGNRDGIALYDSSSNVIKNNKVYDNQRGIRLNENSSENLLTNNEISKNSQYGVYLYGEANNNFISKNSLSNNNSGIYIKSKMNKILGNTIDLNQIGLYLLESASNNEIADNKIVNNKKQEIYEKLDKGSVNILGENIIRKN
ncbi:right-handed parallel beta-helix repeat-containing protein [Candidatus Daviesbacteria bacterium]|nr:right-handed parallel beta-helix repeat-containing protein [Candidatus Daviesbacteria bacterium]